MDNTIILKAKDLATRAHDGQTEKDAQKTPYIFHVQKVAELTALSGGTPEEVAAAWLHDAVEDTPVTFLEIEKELGTNVAHIVEELTDLPEFIQFSTVERKQKQADRIRNESVSARRVKLADQTSTVYLESINTLIDLKERKDYIDGARKIAENCKGVSPLLDELFAKAYREAVTLLEKEVGAEVGGM